MNSDSENGDRVKALQWRVAGGDARYEAANRY